MGDQNEAERDRCRGALVGAAVGDALGMPAEEMLPREVRMRWGVIRDFERAPEGHPCAHLEPGQWTDDTQLTLLLAESLAAVRGFDTGDFGARLAGWFSDQGRPEHRRYPGTACLEVAGRLAEGVPVTASGVDGAGCGAAMRVAPVGVAFRHRAAELRQVAESQALVTHTHPVAVEGAVAVAASVGGLCARGAGDDGGAAVVLEAHRPFLARAEVGLTPEALAAQARRPPADLSPRGPSGWTAHAVPAAVRAFVAHPGDFAAVVLEAANAGGDTDSVGCLAGAMAGVALGWSAIPEAWRSGVEEAGRLAALGDALFELGRVGVPS